MIPENLNVAAVIPIIGKLSKDDKIYYYFKKTIDDLKKSCFVNSIYCVSEDKSLSESVGAKWIDRKAIKNVDKLSLNMLLKQTLKLIESNNDFPDSILYVNHDYVNRPQGIFDELIMDAQYKGCDTIFPGLVDYGHYWYHNEEEYKQTDPSLKPRAKRDPLYKALYGLGCLTVSWVIRTGEIVAGKVGILTIIDPESAKRFLKYNN